METHFKGPRGEYRCTIHNANALPNGWLVERLDGLKRHVVSMHMTREDAFKHARGMSGLHDPPDVVVVDEPLPDRRGLVAHSKGKTCNQGRSGSHEG